jgi:hypothetical protein
VTTKVRLLNDSTGSMFGAEWSVSIGSIGVVFMGNIQGGYIPVSFYNGEFGYFQARELEGVFTDVPSVVCCYLCDQVFADNCKWRDVRWPRARQRVEVCPSCRKQAAALDRDEYTPWKIGFPFSECNACSMLVKCMTLNV